MEERKETSGSFHTQLAAYRDLTEIRKTYVDQFVEEKTLFIPAAKFLYASYFAEIPNKEVQKEYVSLLFQLLELFIAPHHIYLKWFDQRYREHSDTAFGTGVKLARLLFATVGGEAKLEDIPCNDARKAFMRDMSFYKKFEQVQSKQKFSEQVGQLLNVYQSQPGNTDLHVYTEAFHLSELNMPKLREIISVEKTKIVFGVLVKNKYYMLVVIKKVGSEEGVPGLEVLFVDPLVDIGIRADFMRSLKHVNMNSKNITEQLPPSLKLYENELGAMKKQWCLTHLALFLIYDDISTIMLDVHEKPFLNVMMFSLSMFFKTLTRSMLDTYMKATIRMDEQFNDDDFRHSLLTKDLKKQDCYVKKFSDCPAECIGRQNMNDCSFMTLVNNGERLTPREIIEKMIKSYNDIVKLLKLNYISFFEAGVTVNQVDIILFEKPSNIRDFRKLYGFFKKEEVDQFVYNRIKCPGEDVDNAVAYLQLEKQKEEEMESLPENPKTLQEILEAKRKAKYPTYPHFSWKESEPVIEDFYDEDFYDKKVPAKRPTEIILFQPPQVDVKSQRQDLQVIVSRVKSKIEQQKEIENKLQEIEEQKLQLPGQSKGKPKGFEEFNFMPSETKLQQDIVLYQNKLNSLQTDIASMKAYLKRYGIDLDQPVAVTVREEDPLEVAKREQKIAKLEQHKKSVLEEIRPLEEAKSNNTLTEVGQAALIRLQRKLQITNLEIANEAKNKIDALNATIELYVLEYNRQNDHISRLIQEGNEEKKTEIEAKQIMLSDLLNTLQRLVRERNQEKRYQLERIYNTVLNGLKQKQSKEKLVELVNQSAEIYDVSNEDKVKVLRKLNEWSESLPDSSTFLTFLDSVLIDKPEDNLLPVSPPSFLQQEEGSKKRPFSSAFVDDKPQNVRRFIPRQKTGGRG